MSNSKNNKEANLLSMLVDTVFDAGYVLCKWIFGENKTFDLDKFYKDVELKNKQDIYPEVYREFNTELGKKYLVTIPIGLELKHFTDLKNALEQQINKKVDVQYKNGFVEIQFLDKKLSDKIPYSIPQRNYRNKSLEIPIGMSLQGEVSIKTNDIPHTLICGTTNSGKSSVSRVILTTLINLYSPQELELFLIDLKQVELSIFSKVEHCKCFVRNPYQAVSVLDELMEECNRRYEKFFETEVNDIYSYNKKFPNDKMKMQVVFIEEFVMMQLAGKQAVETLRLFSSLSRASGQFLILSCQRPDNTVIDNVLKACLGNRVALRVEDSKNSIICLDAEGAEKLPCSGRGLLKQGAVTNEFQAYWLDQEEAKRLIKPYLKRKELKETTSKNNLEDKFSKYKDTSQVSKKIKKVKDVESANNVKDLSFLDKIDEL